MKIIKHGFLTTRTLTCQHCGCAFEFNVDDIRFSDNEDGVYNYNIQCPECHTSYNITHSDMFLIKEYSGFYE